MYIVIVLVFLVVYDDLVPLSSAHDGCPKDFQCGDFRNLSFPFTDFTQLHCGLFITDCSNQSSPMVSLSRKSEPRYKLLAPPPNSHVNSMRVLDTQLQDSLNQQACSMSFDDALHTANSDAVSFTVVPNITVIRCNKTTDMESFMGLTKYNNCHDFTIYYKNPKEDINHPNPLYNIGTLPPDCYSITLPMAPLNSINITSRLFSLFTAEFHLSWNLSDKCVQCMKVEGNRCTTHDEGSYFCSEHGNLTASSPTLETGKPLGVIIGTGKRRRLGVIIGTVAGGLFILVSLCCAFLVWYRKKVIKRGLYLQSRGIAQLATAKSDLEEGSVFCGIPVFSYTELEEITNSFNESNELGNGGFGTVYYGKLRDGREVAVKYLYEHNFKRMQQFKTEVEILTRLRHQNLVTLYGCTSRRSRDLLLVYEYIPNGTIADHLHGNRAKEGSLPWPIRMNIAIETADALAYLHASDIIHRDVKSNNILLDNNFGVKVADFGLSRLFPHDVTHISTAPQGTPGYVDPEYHQCYQLTDKSDVYSFGVVLIELISSMPAVDMSRKSHDINLSSFAMSRIQSCAFDELIDPSLHIESDPEVMRMTTSVAELAFRCLQNEKEMRPTMEEVAVTLREIKMYEDNIDTIARETNQNDGIRSRTPAVPPSPESEDVVLLRKKFNLRSSPTSVTETWSSTSTLGTSR